MRERIEKVKAFVERLLNFERFERALVADGWSEEMARVGFDFHAQTWRNIDSILPQFNGFEQRERVEKVCHVWPALPGAGVSPVLFGALAGVKTQHIKASRRGIHFAEFFVSIAADLGVNFTVDPLDSSYERVIVSGADETLQYFRDRHASIIGFGHRESIAVVDGTFENFSGLADDILQWNQLGCFSVRAVFYLGEDHEHFCQSLADAMFEKEARTRLSAEALSARIQKRAILEMTSQMFFSEGRNENCTWVRATNQGTKWSGGAPAPCCVAVYQIDPNDPESLFSVIELPSEHRQGVAYSCARQGLERLLLESGFTHISPVGQMQSPPLSWLHDGRSNVEMFFK